MEMEKGNLVYHTAHLKNYNLVDRALGLYGDKYVLTRKALWYTVHAQPIKENIVRLGDIKTDMRMNYAFPLPSGRGKKHIEDLLKI